MTKKINKAHVVCVKIHDEELMENHQFFPEVIVRIPYTNIVLSHEVARWSMRKSGFFYYTLDELEDKTVRDGRLYRKPHIVIEMSSGWRDRVCKTFDTAEERDQWCEENLNGIELILV